MISLLVFTGGSRIHRQRRVAHKYSDIIIVSASIWLGSAAANTSGVYFDRDIDAIMARTKNRPIPIGRIAPTNAFVYGFVLLALSLGLVYYLSPLSALAMLVGFLDYALVYSYILKRRTWSNIILGGFSGVMPILVAYFAPKNPVIPLTAALFMGFLVFFWIPEHIWSLAIRFRQQYAEAKIPMLPVVVAERTSVQIIAVTTIVMVAYSLIPLFVPSLGFHAIYDGTGYCSRRSHARS